MHQFKKLKVWQKAVELTTKLYAITDGFTNHEKFGQISQIRRSAISVPSNMAEGAGRNTPGEFKNFLTAAKDSAYELMTQLIIAENLGYRQKQFSYHKQ